MSAFLGHIHYWLYAKIRRVIERENLIYSKAEELFGDSVEEIREQVWQTYGEPLPEVDLAEVIDQSNIHGWLQRQINIAETREAAFIKELLDLQGDEGNAIVDKAFAEHGSICGKHALETGKYKSSEASGLYQALNDYLLNGMPCDQSDVIVINGTNKLVWEGEACLQENNWKRVGVESKNMKVFYQKWIDGFVSALNVQFGYNQTADTLKGDKVNRHEFSLK